MDMPGEESISVKSILAEESLVELETRGIITKEFRDLIRRNVSAPKDMKKEVIEDEENPLIRKSTMNLAHVETVKYYPKVYTSSNNIVANRLKKTLISNDKINSLNENERINDRIFADFAYSLVDFFSSKEFNMKKLRPLDFSDLKRKIKDAKVSYKQLSKHEKKTYILNLKDLKNKQIEEKNKRIHELRQKGIKFYLVKIKNDSVDRLNKHIDFYIPFTRHEIQMAKTCITNKWEYPPPMYFENTFYSKNITKEMLKIQSFDSNNSISDLSDEKSGSPLKKHATMWTKDFYMQLINYETKKYLNYKEPYERPEGQWVNLKEFSEYFKYFIILHNPRLYSSHLYCDNTWNTNHTSLYQPDLNHYVYHLTPKTKPLFSNNKFSEKFSSVLILFEPNCELNNTMNDFNYYICAELLNSKKEKVCNMLFNNLFSSIQYDFLDYKEEYFLIIKGGLTPYGYYLSLFSDHNIENMSYINYLKKMCDYNTHNFSLQHGNLEAHKFHVISRIKVSFVDENEESPTIFSIKYPDTLAQQYFEVYMVINNEDGKTIEKKLYFDKQFEFLDSYKEAYFVIHIQPPFNMHESNLDIEIITQSDCLSFDILDHLDTFEITDKILPEKHGYAFKELIYVLIKYLIF